MPGLPLILETLSPKATLTLASMTVAAEGLNKFTSAEISPSYASSRSSWKRNVAPLETNVA